MERDGERDMVAEPAGLPSCPADVAGGAAIMSRSMWSRAASGTRRRNVRGRHRFPLDAELGAARNIAAQTWEWGRHRVPLVAGSDGERDTMAETCEYGRRHVPLIVNDLGRVANGWWVSGGRRRR
ncbi:hypothetical protein GCM10009764_57360 [Nocardia ninae]|uniref:Uncharacterized protein n=1 Tax=Nocardia ninae NBRC 108245 TaxID=1210091 RepID=A0A511M4N2_9NOCA|nr:hypothetical protein NN4_01300 [Nocardia ninae NBRC 108245]